jgi:D-alanyl-D-alanine carboxypeptidase (penicillin-binding protein 5/6)
VVEAGNASSDDLVPIGVESWAQSQPPHSSLMFLAPGQIVTLGEIMLGLAVSSGNDAAVAAALYLSPSVQDFAGRMTQEARRLGLEHTSFVEPSGISEQNSTTAADFALFSYEYLRLHPQSLVQFHSVPEFAYPKAKNVAQASRSRPNTIVQGNRNGLLRTFPGVDGLKTGFIEESGYNISLTAERNGTRFIAVILGAPSHPGGERIRNNDGERLLSWAFDTFKTVNPGPVQVNPVRLWKGREKWAELRPEESLSFTAPVGRGASLFYTVELNAPLSAPLQAGSPEGWLVITDDEGALNAVPLVTAKAYERGNLFRRILDSIALFFIGLGK